MGSARSSGEECGALILLSGQNAVRVRRRLEPGGGAAENTRITLKREGLGAGLYFREKVDATLSDSKLARFEIVFGSPRLDHREAAMECVVELGYVQQNEVIDDGTDGKIRHVRGHAEKFGVF